jgi:putative two-component system response regulator
MIGQEGILVVDDTPLVKDLLVDSLSAEGFQVRSVDNGKQALNSIAAKPPQLILLDINMPKMDGFEVCGRLKAQKESREIPVIFISGLLGLDEKVKGFQLGAVDFITKPFQREELLARVRTKLETQVSERTAQLSNLTEKLKKSLEKQHKSMEGIIQTIALTVETRDPYTAGHQRRVASLSQAIAQEMGFSKKKIEGVHLAGIIHDLGKIHIPSEILSKPSGLSDIEFSLIKVHSEVGYGTLKDIDFPWPIARIVLQHHERINGSGYPFGLIDKEILTEAKVLMVADAIEAIASHRPYRPSLGIEAALEEIFRNKGILYDPEVVNVCFKLFREKGFKFE